MQTGQEIIRILNPVQCLQQLRTKNEALFASFYFLIGAFTMITDIKNGNLKENALAVLFDADNTSYKYLKEIFDEVAKYGIATIRRAYGDWTSPELTSWRKELQEYAVNPIQQFRYVNGKNCTDSSLIIEAMDILYKEKIDGIVIVSSDSDYTRLCMRFREEGLIVIGIGRRQTLKPFVNACRNFIYLENLTSKDLEKNDVVNQTETVNNHLLKQRKILEDAYNKLSEDDEFVLLSKVSNMLRNLNPDFDSRNYGYSQLRKMVEAVGGFELKWKNNNNLYVRKVNI